ncbi:MAG: tetraacyldisaccharide 4'-kinase, partial [Rhodobacteraceae bacterium]|nr:tetraacyldisaccharide 4'-kinase [Paracoccaceae bacterium]
ARDTGGQGGDEPLLWAQLPVGWVGADRSATAKAAVAAGAQALVMDDGFQHHSLHKDLSFIVIDAGVGHGNGRVIPAGPLREPLRTGFARADCAILIGEPASDRPPPWLPRDFSCVPARLAPTSETHGLAGRRVVAFAGIGRPRKFFDTLREVGAELVETISFPDHHPYSGPMLMRLERTADVRDALLVTTEKDAMRLPAWFRKRIEVAPVRLGFSDPTLIDELLAHALADSGTASAFSALDDEPYFVPEDGDDGDPSHHEEAPATTPWRGRGRR